MRLPIFVALGLTLGRAGPSLAGSWEDTVAAARGQTVYWNAWGGDERTNDFIAWAGNEVEGRYGVTASAVSESFTWFIVTPYRPSTSLPAQAMQSFVRSSPPPAFQ